MCTSDLCNDNDYGTLNGEKNRLTRPRVDQQNLLVDLAEPFRRSDVAGEIENDHTNFNRVVSASDTSSNDTSSILLLYPFSNKIHTLPSHTLLSISNNQTTSIETMSVDTPVKPLGTQNDLSNKDLETPREEAFLEDLEEDDEIFYDDLAFDVEAETLESLTPKSRVPRQTQSQGDHTSIFYKKIEYINATIMLYTL